MDNPSLAAFVSLNCRNIPVSNRPVSNLQECGVMAVEGCGCGPLDQRHARVTCGKGNELTLYLSVHYTNIYWDKKAALMER